MAIWLPETIAKHVPLTRPISSFYLRHDVICVHTMVGTLSGSWSWSNRVGGTYWALGTSGTGECWQCHDLTFRSAANLYGNPYVIPIENADMGPGFASWSGRCGDVPAFTSAQVDKLVQVIAWLCARFNIPPILIPDTQPGRRGIAYHRQGIDPWRHPNGVLWSNSTGKCCPDNRRIHQLINIIIPRVQTVLNKPAPLPEDDLTPEQAAQLDKIERRLDVVFGAFRMNAEWDKWSGNLPGRVDALYGMRGDLKDSAPSRIVKGDGAATWWVLTPNGKRSAIGRSHVNFLVELGLADAEPQDAAGDYQPFIVTQAELDKVPVVAPLS